MDLPRINSSRIENSIKHTKLLVDCFMDATPSRYHHHADSIICIEHIRWKIPEASVNTCWVYSVRCLSKIELIFSVTVLICFAICFILAHSHSGGRLDIFTTHLIIIIKSELSIFHIVVIFFRGCVPEGVVRYAVDFIYIPVKMRLVSFINLRSYDVRKWLITLCPNGHIRIFACYITQFSSLCRRIWQY